MEIENKATFTVTKWNAVASWVSDSTGVNCMICREALDRMCPHCILLNDPDISCVVAKGICYHAFHKHCLDRWFQSQKAQNCLLCSKVWNQIWNSLDQVDLITSLILIIKLFYYLFDIASFLTCPQINAFRMDCHSTDISQTHHIFWLISIIWF